jgi:hypothetical protein
LKVTKFQNITSLAIGIDENFGAENTVIKYIGLKGEITKVLQTHFYEIRTRIKL